MTDQNIGREPDQFPKHEKHDEIVRENDSEHGEHEERQRREVAGLAFIISHVTQRVDVDERADAGDQNSHRPAQLIQGEAERDVEDSANSDPRELS